MKCPNCAIEVFDMYTTEERIRKLYHANQELGWAKNRMRILAETIEDRLGPNSGLPPVSLQWLAETLREIHDKMHPVT